MKVQMKVKIISKKKSQRATYVEVADVETYDKYQVSVPSDNADTLVEGAEGELLMECKVVRSQYGLPVFKPTKYQFQVKS